mgnify:CR=1 FL=1
MISIVIANYNSEKYITETLDSILKQTYKNYEVWIIDDCSEDSSIKKIDDYIKRDKRFNLVKLIENSGPAAARNIGIERAQGKYLTFIDSDDIWDNNFLEKSLAFMKKSRYEFVFSSYRRSDENLNKLHDDYIVPSKVNYSDLLKSNRISCLTAFIDISKIGKMYMDETYTSHEDYSLWLNISKKIGYAYGNQEVLATYRIRRSSVSRNKIKMIFTHWIFLRKSQKIAFFKALYYFSIYIVNGIKKYS